MAATGRKPMTDAEITKGFDEFKSKATELRGLAKKAGKKSHLPVAVYKTKGGAQNTKLIFTQIEEKLKEVIDSKPSAAISADIKAVSDEIKKASDLAQLLGADALQGYSDLFDETKQQFEESCARVKLLYKTARDELDGELKSNPGDPIVTKAIAALKSQEDDINNLKNKSQEKLLEDLKRLADVHETNLAPVALDPKHAKAARQAQFEWQPVIPVDKEGGLLTLRQRQDNGIKPGSYKHKEYDYWIDITKGEKDALYASITMPYNQVLSGSAMKERVWQAYLLMNPTGKKVPLEFGCPGTPPKAATLENLRAAYEGGHGKNRVWTRILVNQVKDLFALAKEKNVPIDIEAYMALLKERAGENRWFGFKTEDYYKMMKEVHDHNATFASVEQHERKNLAGNMAGEIQADEQKEAVTRGVEEKEYLDGIRALVRPLPDPEVVVPIGDEVEEGAEPEELEGNDAAKYLVGKEVKFIIDKIDDFERLVGKIKDAKDQPAIARIQEELNGLRGFGLSQKKLKEVSEHIGYWKKADFDFLPPATKTAIADLERRLPTVTEGKQARAQEHAESKRKEIIRPPAAAAAAPAPGPAAAVVPATGVAAPEDKKEEKGGSVLRPSR